MQFFEFGDLFRKDAFQLVDQLVDHEIHDCDIGEEPGIELALVLMLEENGLDLFLPVVGHALLVLQLAGGAGYTGHADHCSPEVASHADLIKFGLILCVFAEEIHPSRLLHQVGSDANRPSNHKVSILQVRQILQKPLLPLRLLEHIPFLGVEKPINVVKVEILAQQATDLPLGPEWIVANNHWCCLGLFLHLSDLQ